MVACYCVDENLGKCPISVGDPLEMSSLTQLTGNRRDNSKSKKRKTNKQTKKQRKSVQRREIFCTTVYWNTAQA